MITGIKENKNLVHLHLHTAKGSLLDSILKVEDAVKFAKENNQNAIALTDHGTMQSYVDFWKECDKQNVKPIIGSEVYEVESLEDAMRLKNTDEKNKGTLQRFHLVLLAKSKIGFQNLLKISSESHTKFFYTKPLIDLKCIKENNLGEGIICLTACQAGRLSKIITGEYKSEISAKDYFTKLEDTFENTYVEIQSHNTKSQYIANKKLLEFAKKNNKKYTITCDCHMLEKNDTEAHDIFIYLAKDYEVGESYNGCYMQTNEDVYNELNNNISEEDIQIGINESFNISEMVEKYDIGVGQEDQMPIIEVPKKFKNKNEWYDYLIEEGFKNKGHDKLNKEEIRLRKERLKNEKEVLEYLGYIDYFLMLHVLINKFRSKKIPLGYSRGSGGNCLSLFYLNVTQIDSYKWDLDFSRFGNKGRKGSAADYDIDISRKKRQNGIEIMRELFGRNNVAPICTFNSFSTKVAIRDIGKVLDEKGIYNIPYEIRDEVSKAIPAIKTLNDLGEKEEKEVLLQEFLNQSNVLTKYYEKYPLWFKYVMKLEGLPKSRGKHAGGVLITPKPLVEYCPLCLDKDGEQMVQLEMHNAMDDLGLVKMDLLGLKTLDVVDDTLNFINKTWNDFDINHLDLEDKNVYKDVYAKGNTANVFQFESYECIDMCKQASVDNIEDVIAINAFNRPGTKAQFPDYVENKKDPENATILHEDLKEIFRKTHGVLLYQEQVLKILGLAGLNESDQDKGRRAMGKKDKEKMIKLKPQVVEGFKKINWSDEKINELWELLVQQSKYNFNKGHKPCLI
jgi:DNA polymerase-3 subunit alpha